MTRRPHATISDHSPSYRAAMNRYERLMQSNPSADGEKEAWKHVQEVGQAFWDGMEYVLRGQKR